MTGNQKQGGGSSGPLTGLWCHFRSRSRSSAMIPRSRATNPSFHEKRAALHEPLDCRPREKRECSRGKRYVEERGQGWQECWDEKIHGCGSGCTWSKAWIILFACFCWPLSTKREFFDGSWIMSTGSGLGLAKK